MSQAASSHSKGDPPWPIPLYEPPKRVVAKWNQLITTHSNDTHFYSNPTNRYLNKSRPKLILLCSNSLSSHSICSPSISTGGGKFKSASGAGRPKSMGHIGGHAPRLPPGTTHPRNIPLQHILATLIHPFYTPLQHIVATLIHPFYTPFLHTLATLIHPFYTPFQHILATLIHPFNTPFQHIFSTHPFYTPFHTPFQHTLSTHPFVCHFNTSSRHILTKHLPCIFSQHILATHTPPHTSHDDL